MFYAFDIILYKNNILKNTCLLERLNILKYDISFKNNPNVEILYKLKKFYFDDIYKDSIKLLKKKYVYIYKGVYYNIYIDGLIFTDVKEDYINSITFKWKENITFDFKINKLNLNGNEEEWYLMCYTVDNECIKFEENGIDKILISNNIAKNYNDGDIVEFGFDENINSFFPIRKREDKNIPNFIEIARDNWQCLINPIKFKN